MKVNWAEVQTALYPMKDYEDLCQRYQASFAYPFVRDTFNFTMPKLVSYTQQMLGEDTRGRYSEYSSLLVRILTELYRTGIGRLLDLVEKVDTRGKLEFFTEQSGILAQEIVAVQKFLVYWLIPMEKYLSGLVRDDPITSDALKVLRGIGIRTNLQLLQQGLTAEDRQVLADSSGLPEAVIVEWVNRADFSRMPWASKATLSNIMGAGYGSLAQLASANPEQLYADFFNYGKKIGKNLKFGNEIESSYRISKIVPVLVQ